MAKHRDALLDVLYQKKHSCRLADAEAALRGWGFQQGRKKRKAQVWTNGATIVTLHRPHGKHMDPGAVARVIGGIEQVRLREKGNGSDE